MDRSVSVKISGGKMKFLAVLLFVAALGLSSAEKDRFDNYKVFAVEVDTEEQLNVLHEIEKIAFSSYDFWKRPGKVGLPVDIMVPPHKMSEFEGIMKDLNFRTTLKIPDVQVLIDNEQPKNLTRNGFTWDRYATMDEINEWMAEMVQRHSNVMTAISYGVSFELEPIRGVLISYRPGNPAIFIESQVHAREWIAGATATWLINELITSNDPEVRHIAENYDWYIFPVCNPDGYRHSINTNRMWRKTRSRHGIICHGADPNRNFGYMWQDGSGPGASSNPCSEIFAGPAPFSELETGQLANFVLQRRDHIKMYLSFHSFSQLLIYPYAHTPVPSQHADDLNRIGQAAADRLRGPFGTHYDVHNMHSLYIGTGISADWSYGAAGIILSYVYEFRDTGTHGFLLPANQIIPNAHETMHSLIGMIAESKRLRYLP